MRSSAANPRVKLFFSRSRLNRKVLQNILLNYVELSEKFQNIRFQKFTYQNSGLQQFSDILHEHSNSNSIVIDDNTVWSSLSCCCLFEGAKVSNWFIQIVTNFCGSNFGSSNVSKASSFYSGLGICSSVFRANHSFFAQK